MNLNLATSFALTLTLSYAAVGQTDDLARLQQEVVRSAASQVADTVVQIETLGGKERVGRMLIGTAPTSGLIVSEDGFIVSSAFNFIQEPSSILVTLPDGQRRPAEIVARDRSRMLVLLKIQTDTSLPIAVAVPRAELSVGQTVIALGKTYDVRRANLSVGILSALNRIWGKAVQTDANVSPSNYGGPLIDLYGRVIGVLVPMSPQSDEELSGVEWYDSGIGFAVPLSDIYRQLNRLKSGHDLFPGKLGFAFEGAHELDGDTIIAVVKANSPAAKAGLEPGDRLIAVNGSPVERHSQVHHLLGPLYAGETVELAFVRDGETRHASATLTDRIPPYEHAFLGILTQRSSPSRSEIRYVFAESPAAKAGLEAGDTLTHFDGMEVTETARLRNLLARHQPGDVVSISWEHNDEERTAEIQLNGLPEVIPDLLPESEAGKVDDDFPTGKLAIEIPEEPNKCTAFVPESVGSGHVAGLLVMLVKPGTADIDALIDQWRDVCEAQHLVLLLPEAQDPQRWQPPEAAFVRKSIDHAMGRFGPDEQRIVVYGEEASGAMAYLVGLRYRDVVRGIVAVDASPPQLSGNIENEPLQRLSILTLSEVNSPLNDRIEASNKALRELKFPVTHVPRIQTDESLNDVERSMVGRWVDQLDRL